MKIAAFDLGTTWACADNCRETPLVGHHEESGKRPEKLARFRNNVRLTLFNPVYNRLDVIVFERPFARGQAATRLLWGMAGQLESIAHDRGVAVLDMTPAEIKKWATGNGRAEKADMIAAAQRLGYTGDNEHEADAWCLLKFAEATLEITP